MYLVLCRGDLESTQWQKTDRGGMPRIVGNSHGVPQEHAFRPLLFTLYMNDTLVIITGFVYDTVILCVAYQLRLFLFRQ